METGGNFFRLGEAYDLGLISKEDVRNIHELFVENGYEWFRNNGLNGIDLGGGDTPNT